MLFIVQLLLMVRGRERFPARATVLVGTISFLSVAVVGFPATPFAGAVNATVGAVIAGSDRDSAAAHPDPHLGHRSAAPGVHCGATARADSGFGAARVDIGGGGSELDAPRR